MKGMRRETASSGTLMAVPVALRAAQAKAAWFTYLREEFIDELGGLHFVEPPHPGSEELEGQVIDALFVEFIITDKSQDESALPISAQP